MKRETCYLDTYTLYKSFSFSVSILSFFKESTFLERAPGGSHPSGGPHLAGRASYKKTFLINARGAAVLCHGSLHTWRCFQNLASSCRFSLNFFWTLFLGSRFCHTRRGAFPCFTRFIFVFSGDLPRSSPLRSRSDSRKVAVDEAFFIKYRIADYS